MEFYGYICMPATDDVPLISKQSIAQLNHQQQVLFGQHWRDFVTFLRNEGKDPNRQIGYAASNVRPTARRVLQVFQHQWDTQETPIVIELSTDHADKFIWSLDNDEVRKNNNDSYQENSKAEFVKSLRAYFDFLGVDWTPDIQFNKTEPADNSDPFDLEERERLFTASLEYQSPPNYGNVTPEERDRWQRHLSQRLDIPVSEIGPDEWDELRRSWKYPSIISISLDGGLRAALIGRLLISHLHLEKGYIDVPPEISVKNDLSWEIELSSRSVNCLKRWLEQRQNKAKYDESEHVWLNRNGNPYNSANLNTLLDNLVEHAGIEPAGRKLTWHSIRHSTGMYIYDQERDLAIVADMLRHASIESARRYAHPTPEARQDVLESIQGGR